MFKKLTFLTENLDPDFFHIGTFMDPTDLLTILNPYASNNRKALGYLKDTMQNFLS